MSLYHQQFTPNQKWLLIGLTACAFLLRLHRLDVQSLWFDEAFSAFISSSPPDAAIQSMLEEGLQHSPLYYLLLRPFAASGFSEFSLRFLSVAAGVVAIPLMAQMGRIAAKAQVGLLAAVLLTVNPFHTWYSQEARMYTLVIVAALGAMFFFSRNLRCPRWQNWLGLTLFTVIGLNTHYFAFFIPLIQFIFIVVTLKQNYRLLRPWLATQLLAGLSILPWLIIIVRWGKFYFGSAALQPPTGYDLLQTVWNFSLGYTVELTLYVGLMLALLLLLFVLGINAARRTGTGLLLILWGLTPPLLAFLMSFRLPMYVDRYISLSLPAFLLLVVLGLYQWPPQKVSQRVLAGIILGAMLAGLWRVYYDTEVYNRADWRSLGAYLEENTGPGDVIALWKYQTLLSLFFYYQGSQPLKPVMIGPQVILPALPASAGAYKVWLVLDHPNNSTHLAGHCQDFSLPALRLPAGFQEWLTKNQNRLVEVKEFSCVRLQVYE
ncbi:MAG: glycosyltransferase family 39 protein [Anaerolineae bacterium]|nr:glycosyltransferase family 39 protein [Anaerolineae bacterium]